MPSKVIKNFDYDAAHARLTIMFTTERVYEYSLVPVSLAAQFKAAVSKGAFFNAQIRDRFPCRDVTPKKPAPPNGDLLDRLKRSVE